MHDTKAQGKIVLPTDDGGIAQALSQLDAQLDEWIGALRDGVATMAEVARQPAPDLQFPEPEPAPEPEPVQAAPEPAPPVEVAPEQPVVEPVAEAPTIEVPAVTETKPAKKRGRKPAKPKTKQAEPEPSAEPTPIGEGEDPDEALLDSLDPDTAKAIRVKRRLTGNKRSVRELLDELEGESGKRRRKSSESDSQRKGWWR